MPADVAPPSIRTSDLGLGVFLVSGSFGQWKAEEYGNDIGYPTHLKALDLEPYMSNPQHSVRAHRCNFQQKQDLESVSFPGLCK